MAGRRKHYRTRLLLRMPLFLVFLFLFYLLGKHSISLVNGFSLSRGYPTALVTTLCAFLLVFFIFIGVLIVQNFIRDFKDH